MTRPKPRPEPTPDDVAKALAEIARRKRERALDFYKPYPKQMEFHALGSSRHERALIAANRTGKTYCAGAEVAMHLTGLYPKDWTGKRFDKATRWWAAGTTGLAVRDTNQRILFGTPSVIEDRGTGMVPKASVNWDKGLSLAHGYAGLYDTVQVKHAKGGISTVRFMTYEQGRLKWQAETLDGIWCDEEPPMDIYSEGLTRLVTTNGIMLCTFTPLLGMSEVVMRYMQESSPDRAWVGMTIDDAGHIPESERARIIAGYPAHERDARAKGIPMLGSGRIFQISEERISEDAIRNVPPHWAKLWAIDFGIDHPFAAVLLAWDKDADVVHVLHSIRMKDARAIDHAAAMKPYGKDVPVAWPHDGSQRDKGGGEPLSKIYKSHGLKMLPTHSAWPDGSISTEAGILEMQERMESGRLKVASHLKDWFEEMRLYHRKDGLIVKEHDDLLSATRIGIMAKRNARVGAIGLEARQGGSSQMCRDVDFDVFQPFGEAA